jgi:hypothetical protein
MRVLRLSKSYLLARTSAASTSGFFVRALLTRVAKCVAAS